MVSRRGERPSSPQALKNALKRYKRFNNKLNIESTNLVNTTSNLASEHQQKFRFEKFGKKKSHYQKPQRIYYGQLSRCPSKNERTMNSQSNCVKKNYITHNSSLMSFTRLNRYTI